ncbi:hypothetical protein [Spiroplasma cantharicola]|uniref:hypothetical protein n=1 Tax=Spiroplasma cantharicola TaxID=362837 RepID=UPI0006B45731|nr:hypothetical protein [Spiroplasma cantharicola]
MQILLISLELWEISSKIISDVRYVVYRIKDINDTSNFIYYQSQDLALEAVKKSAKQKSNINVQVYKTYLYNYQTSLGLLYRY